MYVESDGKCNHVVECSVLMSWPLDQGPLPNITTPLTANLLHKWETVLQSFMHCFIQLSCSVALNPCVVCHFDQGLM